MNLAELRARLKEIATEMDTILEAGADSLTDEKAAAFDTLDAEAKEVSDKIEALEAGTARVASLAAHKKRLASPRPSVAQAQLTTAPVPGQPDRAGGDPTPSEFATDHEAWVAYAQHLATRGAKDDPRLANLYAEGKEISGFQMPGLSAEQSMGTGGEGGFAIPVQFRDQLMSVPVAPAVVRPLATVIPSGDPPDAEISMPALDQTSAQNMFGGVSVVWFGEGAAMTETDANILPVTLKPQEFGAFITATAKLLRNWQAAATLLPMLLRRAIIAEEDLRFIRGDGVAKPLGFSNHASAVAVTRDTGNEINYEDLVAMEARMLTNGRPIWLTSRRTAEQLRLLVNPNNQLIWGDGDANTGRPASLLGNPIVYAPRTQALGTRGDIILCDLSYYLIKDGSPPIVASSDHVNFTSNKTVIKAVNSVDGQPWLSGPVREEDGNDYSPFVEITT